MAKIATFIIIICMQLVNGMYIKPSVEPKRATSIKTTAGNPPNTESDWSIYKRKLGLTDEKVELLKQQKNQHTTMDLLNRFIKENPKYTIETPKAAVVNKHKKMDPFLKLYQTLFNQHKISKSTLKTSLNFELGEEQSKKSLKRPRRKIAVRMISDMPTEKIDDLLKMFTAQHGIDNTDVDSKQSVDADDVEDYSDHSMVLPTALDQDYVYENLYEDEEDLAAPTKSHSNTQYGSFQDLILQANRNQWRREFEETKLHSQNNDHFV